MRKKTGLFLLTIVFTLVSMTGCGNVRFAYENPVSGEVYYGEDEEAADGESSDDKGVEGEANRDGKDDKDDNDDKDGGSILYKLGKRSGNEVNIAGDWYELNADAKTLVGTMVRNGLVVRDAYMGMLIDEQANDTEQYLGRFTSDAEGYNEDGYNELYYDGSKLKREYDGKVLTVSWPLEKASSRRGIVIWINNITQRYGTCKYIIPDGYTEKSAEGELNDDYWMRVDEWGLRVSSSRENTEYCAMFVDGEAVNLRDYRKQLDELLVEKELGSMEEFHYYFHENLQKGRIDAYGTFTGFDLLYLNDELRAKLETEEHKNCAAANLALMEYLDKLESGEVENIVTYTMEWDATGEAEAADLGIVVYR